MGIGEIRPKGPGDLPASKHPRMIAEPAEQNLAPGMGGGGIQTMTYDGAGFRRVLNGATNFLYDRITGKPGIDPVLLETDVANSTLVQYTPAMLHGLFSQRRSGTSKSEGSWRFYHADALGSTRLLTDSSQGITDTDVYEAWGRIVASSGATVNPLKYVGMENYYDDGSSGLLLLGVRYYDPKVGRFVSVDPARDGENWYVYANNNPVTRSDPSGHQDIYYYLTIGTVLDWILRILECQSALTHCARNAQQTFFTLADQLERDTTMSPQQKQRERQYLLWNLNNSLEICQILFDQCLRGESGHGYFV